MKPAHIQILGIAITLAGFVFIGFLYWTEPRSFAEVATKSQVAIGSYQVDRTELARGIDLFRKEDFIGARVALDRADPEKRDAQTQFYVAYSFYRQGWGRLSNDDALFHSGIEAANRVIALDPSFRSTDESLGLKTATELKNELEEGLKITPSDFNPMRLTRERK
jgi:hypothetical protein